MGLDHRLNWAPYPSPKRTDRNSWPISRITKELFSFIAEQLSQVDIDCLLVLLDCLLILLDCLLVLLDCLLVLLDCLLVLLDCLLVLSTKIENVVSDQHCDIASLHPCNHAEADTRIMLHLTHGVQQGHAHLFVCTVDSDVVVLAVSIFQELQELGVEELLVKLSISKHYLDIPIHHVCLKLRPQKSISLPLFHALTVCDTTSQMLGCGKKTAWAVWDAMPRLTATFLSILDDPTSFTLESDHLKYFERFVVLMYSKSCSAEALFRGTSCFRYNPPNKSSSVPACKEEHTPVSIHLATGNDDIASTSIIQ